MLSLRSICLSNFCSVVGVEDASGLPAPGAFGRSRPGAGCCLDPASAGGVAAVLASAPPCGAVVRLPGVTLRNAPASGAVGSTETAGVTPAAAAAPGVATGSAGSAASSDGFGALAGSGAGMATAGFRDKTETGG